MIDPDFGACVKIVDAWHCLLESDQDYLPFKRISTYFRLVSSSPTDEQRETFCIFKNRYADLWPTLSGKLLELHDEIATLEELAQKIEPTLSIRIPGIVGSEKFDVTIIYEFKNDPLRKGYFISMSSWEIKSALVAE